MSSEYKNVSLGELADIKHGWAFKSDFFSDLPKENPVVVGIGNFRYEGGFRFESTKLKYYEGEFPNEYLLDAGEILLVMTCQTAGGEILGIPGRIPSDNRRYLHNQRLGKFVIKRRDVFDNDYAYNLFKTADFNRFLASSATGTKILHTSPDRILQYSFELPPIHEQKAIAHILGTLDDKIELNRKTNETLEAMAKALFKSWFVDFDPVRAKAEGRPTGLPAEISDLFPDSFEDSELGEIPSGWRVTPVGDVVECVGGSTPSTSEADYWDGGEYFWATPKDLSSLSEPFLLDTAKKITADGVQRISSGILPVGTVLLSSRAPVGYVAAACVPVSINQGFIAFA